jgi:hypothetical protein
MAGGRKSNKQSREMDSRRNLSKQNRHGKKDKTALTRTVRRDTEPITKPPVHDQPSKRTVLQSKKVNPGPSLSPVLVKMAGAMSR